MTIDLNLILSNLGIVALNDMQETMCERCVKDNNIILLSPTGSGKTLGYLLPVVRKVDVEKDYLQVVVVVPSRELAIQSEEVLKKMKLGIRSLSLYGGRPAMEENRKIKEVKPQMVFATPGRLLDHLSKDNLLGGGVSILVVDEFDKCLELGFLEDMQRIAAAFTFTKQCLLTSATDMEALPDFIARIGAGKKYEAQKLDFLNASDSLEERLKISRVPSPRKDKLETLGKLLSHVKGEPAIVFVAHRESVDRIADYLKQAGFAVSAYHGGMEQEMRERALYKFRSGCVNVMVSTDLAARGLDIPEVKAIIHYHLPLTNEAFIHRSGRTARWDAIGEAFLIVGPEEQLPDFVETDADLDVEGEKMAAVSPKWTTLYIGRGKKDKLSKMDVVGFLCKKGGLKSDEIGRIDVGPHHVYVAVLSSRMKMLNKNVAGEKIKGMKTLIEEMRK